jgi:photosystem II stability/assembly factor-like uncharacterized protein
LVVVLTALFLLRACPVYASHGTDIVVLAIDPQTPSTLYAGTSGGYLGGGGVFKSMDGGASWTAIGPTNGASISALGIDPRTPTTLYAATSDPVTAVYKSTDGGASWNATGLTGISVSSLAIDPLTPTTLYAGTDDAVYKSTDGGASWNATAGLTGRVSSLVIEPLTPTTLYAGTTTGLVFLGMWPPLRSGVYKSTDGGASWIAVMLIDPSAYDGSGGEGFYCGCGGVLALAIDPLVPTTVLGVTGAFTYQNYWREFVVWTAPGFVIKSTDGGTTWATSAAVGGYDPVSIPTLAIAPRTDLQTPTTLYAGTVGYGGDVLKSADGGTTWSGSRLTDLGGVSAVAIEPLNPTTIYAGTSGVGGVLKSTDGGTTWNPTGPITWLHISSVSLNPASVIGGNTSTGTVTLTAAAPEGGAVITLGSSATVASVPASVTVAAGATSANFTVSTIPVAVGASTSVSILGTYDGSRSYAFLTVTPAASLSSLTLDPTSVRGGTASIGTVTLSAPAPAGGAEVPLSSSNAAVATVPLSVTVPAGATSASFTVSTSPVTASTSVTIGAANYSTLLTVTPTTTLSSLSLTPVGLIAGGTSTGTVTLSAPAPAGGAVVPLASSSTAIATVPTSVTVAAGATSANFVVSTSTLTGCAPSTATISATYGEVARSAVLTVTPPADTVAIQQADYFASRHELRVAATSTGPSATLQVYVTSTGQLIGTLKRYDGNRYSGRFTWPVILQNITVRSSLCGSATRSVILK